MKHRLLSAVSTAALLAGLVLGATAGAVLATGSAYTSTNTNVDGTGHCANGNEDVNCNIYDLKESVWINGGPSAYTGDGDYFFAVLAPGGQADPNDGSANNLSDDVDAYTNRTFSASGGVITYSGTHDFDSNKIRLADYADTTNPGGVYILAICSLADGYPVAPSSCKYDAFKIGNSGAAGLTISKDADGANDKTYTWDVTKDVDKTRVEQVGGSATFNYSVKVTHDSGTIGNVTVAGTITVFNPNLDSVTGVDVTDELSDGTTCTVTGGSNSTVTTGDNTFKYKCDLTALPQGQLDNTATVTWPAQSLLDGDLAAGSDDFTFSDIAFTETVKDDCVSVGDSYAGALGSACVGDANPKEFTYSRIITVLPGCHDYGNTATSTTNDTGTQDTASKTVTVCGPAATGALTMGFWKNTNGQNLIKTYCNPASGNLGTYLKSLGAGAGPFSDAPTSCSTLASYVQTILNAASAKDMNKMLKAQMLASALDVWFSGPGWSSTTLSKIKPPSSFLLHNTLGSFDMDLTAICPMVDNLNNGTATCKNGNPSTDANASGAVPWTHATMQTILNFAATTGTSPWATGAFTGTAASSSWYGTDRTKQEILKNIFDQFNNQAAFGA